MNLMRHKVKGVRGEKKFIADSSWQNEGTG